MQHVLVVENGPLLDEGVERYPDGPALRLERALMLYRKGEYEKAAADARLLEIARWCESRLRFDAAPPP